MPWHRTGYGIPRAGRALVKNALSLFDLTIGKVIRMSLEFISVICDQ